MQGETTQRTGGEARPGVSDRELTLQWVWGGEYRERHVLSAARYRIGRSASSHMRLEHSSVSREHAEIYRQGPIYALRDLGSTNGTYVNGRRTQHGVVAAGDVIRAGEFVGVLGTQPRWAEPLDFGEIAVGLLGGTALAAALATTKRAAATNIPIVLVGSTGTGKERVARAIHQWSGRGGRFHALNCSALPTLLAEAELFGHERGAFTGAERQRIGHFRAAEGGTLLLDEVAELPGPIQAKLLRALEEREVTPLGSTEPIPIDVRIIVAGHEPLERYRERGTMREDLCARLAGFQATLPDLACRRDEVPGLFFYFLEKHGKRPIPQVEPRLLERLCICAWRGNVRELELFTRKLLALRGNEAVLRCEFADDTLNDGDGASPSPEQIDAELFQDRRDQDRSRLADALTRCNGNMTKAAASIGISRRRAYRLLSSAQSANDSHSSGAPVWESVEEG